MYISRGFQPADEANETGEPRALARPAPQSIDYHLVHDRLTMLERLTALRAGGTLSEEEFLAEKAGILALPADELVLRHAVPAEGFGPSLLGRVLNWKVLALGAVSGVSLGFFTRPEDTISLLARLTGSSL